MKIAFGFIMQDGPYGGGNSVIRSLANGAAAAGHTVVWSLNDDDIDVIVYVDPRVRSPNISFSAGAVLRYLTFRNSKAIAVQQIHDCDERKNTRSMNFRQRLAGYAADHIVCVGSWMLDLNLVPAGKRSFFTAILNGGETEIFHDRGHIPWSGSGPMKLITHHWGGHWMKGFDVYKLLDDLLDDQKWQDIFEFTYIGNIPRDFQFRNVRHLQPVAGQLLADELRNHDVYITASINEPAGLHHIEGAMCGLPILYRTSGALPEYCEGFGISFDGPDTIQPAIRRMREEYDTWRASLASYGHIDAKMIAGHLRLFEELTANRASVTARRRLFKNPFLYLLNQIPF